MDDSSTATRRSPQWTSTTPSRQRSRNTSLSSVSILSGGRNSELSHQIALAAAQAEHDRVREEAERVYRDYESQEEYRRLVEQQDKLQAEQKRQLERLRIEEQLRAEEERLRALKIKTVPKLPPEPPAPAEVKQDVRQAFAEAKPETKQETKQAHATVNGFTTPKESTQPLPPTNSEAVPTTKPNPFSLQQPAQSVLSKPVNGPAHVQTSLPFDPTRDSTPSSQPSSLAQATSQGQGPNVPQTYAPSTKVAAPHQNGHTLVTGSAKPPAELEIDRYFQIHQNLKKLRAFLLQQSKASPPLKSRMGDMRRELRKNMGQLVSKGDNKSQISNIQAILDKSLDGSVPSAMVDPSEFIIGSREPAQGALHNEPMLPSLFLYLLNHFSKAVVGQFISQCASDPATADPIGVIVAFIYSRDNFLWRGKALIDILMAKMCVCCPILFGRRGNDKTDQGRARIGWWKMPTGHWVDDQTHFDRMKGLGTGFGAIALRNFTNSKYANPYPPSNYWSCLARIVNTPPEEISNSQGIVLGAIIDNNYDRFLQFYGNAAIAALRKALVEFPNKAVAKTPAVRGLGVLADLLKQDRGLDLQQN